MGEPQAEKHIYTKEEYLILEEQAEFKSEYYEGVIRAMSGGTPQHSRIIANTITALNNALSNSSCFVYDNNLKVAIAEQHCFVYPDAMVVCGEEQLAEGRKDVITNPLLVVEVLSGSTEDYDKYNKFHKYRSLSSFREYVLISQKKPQVEVYFKQDEKHWLYTIVKELEERIYLQSIGCELFLKDIYNKIKF